MANLELEVTELYIDHEGLTMPDQGSGTVQDPTVDFLFVRDTVPTALERMGYCVRRREGSSPPSSSVDRVGHHARPNLRPHAPLCFPN